MTLGRHRLRQSACGTYAHHHVQSTPCSAVPHAGHTETLNMLPWQDRGGPSIQERSLTLGMETGLLVQI